MNDFFTYIVIKPNLNNLRKHVASSPKLLRYFRIQANIYSIHIFVKTYLKVRGNFEQSAPKTSELKVQTLDFNPPYRNGQPLAALWLQIGACDR